MNTGVRTYGVQLLQQNNTYTQSVFTCSKSTTETTEQCVKFVQN